MGSGPSKSKQQNPQLPEQTQSGPLNRFKNTVNTGITPPQAQPSNIYDLQFILANPPPITLQPQTNTSNNKVKEALDSIKAKIIEYNNKTWNFGNQSDGQPQLLLEEKNYNNFLVFVTDLIKKKNTSNQSLITVNAKSFREKQDIVREIHNLVSAGGNKLVNVFFEVEMSEIFPNFPGVKPKDPMNVTLLGLASIIGAEHIVIYLLMIGADQSITKTDNRDSATLMLSFQIGIYKLLQQQQPINLKYFIILPRILYILFLLGSIGEGIDLSAIFETNEEKNNKNNSAKPKVPVKSSILNMLAQMPGNTSYETARQTLQSGGSIPLLLEILERNNSYSFTPKFFKTVNSPETPYDINVLYSVLMNPNIDDETKIKLTELLVLNYNANITNVPTFVGKRTNITIFDRIILAIDDIKFTNPQTKLSILEIFSVSNKEFKDRLEESGLLRKYSNSKSNTNKNAIIKRLQAEVELLRQKSKLITNKIDFFANKLSATGLETALLNAQIKARLESLTPEFAQPIQPQNKGITQPIQLKNPSTNLIQSPGLAQQFSSTNLIQSPVSQLQQIQQPGATLGKSFGNRVGNGLKGLKGFWKKGNNGKAEAQKNIQLNLKPVNMTLPQAASQMNSSTNPPQKPKGLFNGLSLFGKKNNKGPPNLPLSSESLLPVAQTNLKPERSLANKAKGLFGFGKKKNKGLIVAQPALLSSSPPNLSQGSSLLQPVLPLNNPLNTTKSSALLQTVSPLISPPNLSQGSSLLQPLVPLNTTTSPGLLQPEVPLITSQNPTSLLPVAQSEKSLKNKAFAVKQNNRQSGGKQIQMRTYHFLKHKKYSERAFIAERPIIAADNAYDFMKLHYDIGSKKITFTIHDRVNNKKYKYTARTLKDGTNVIKSAK